MKKVVLVAAIAVLLALPAGAYAAQFITLPWTNNIYNVSETEESNSTVSVFDDGDNKCYVVIKYASSGGTAISCVKR